ncbi:hypothetical protein [Candidatus Berkiella aquae]|uniref:Uncharacterized protein n=1 Tax=Candidatus Berkiella aquae TaxID=295108 RepID=A0A0Q9YMG8_9GAMM|nr:hypothetical protein [Candidatus Berkiella aquae]MCS5710360.1 hypothetical protein [Candidatus Berkiella aquae]
MLSFTDICDQLGSEALNSACEWAGSNPAIALGLTLGGTLLATVGGLYFSRNRHAQPVVVPRMQTRGRQSLREAIADTNTDLDLAQEIADMKTAENMPLQTIVSTYLAQKAAEKQMNATQIRNWVFEQAFPGQQRIVGKAVTQAELNEGVLRLLKLPIDGKVPTLSAERERYNAVLRQLDLAHLQVTMPQRAKIS